MSLLWTKRECKPALPPDFDEGQFFLYFRYIVSKRVSSLHDIIDDGLATSKVP